MISNFLIIRLDKKKIKLLYLMSMYSSKEMEDKAMAVRKPLLDEVKSKIKNI